MSPDVALIPCNDCDGHGWVIGEGYELGCCGNVLESGECCAAKYGEANLVPVPVQEQVACPTCLGAGEIAVRR